ncbi:MAG TPA: M48 family metallopeptidase [Gemmataceae bacterium]|nr:M48 family metallopeptidase [Gemmataceae bacterium]
MIAGKAVTDIAPLYPPTPANVPPDITRLDRAYRSRVVAMIGGLFAFLLLYLVVIALAGLAVIAALTVPLPEDANRGPLAFLVVRIGGILIAGLLCLFLVKGLFKGRRVERSAQVTLREADHPDLFAFIRRVHEDAGAPGPRRVYASPDVNAGLVYDTSLLNLVVPPKKDLLIGLGLVNVVNLVEFKAVLAHEFGHFAQRSVGLGSYLYMANRVMEDVIHSRDAFDRLVDSWCRIDIRISFPAWGLKGVLWVVRRILSGMYQGLNLLHLSLNRQMELKADNVAVRVAGSDALIHGLARTAFANECLADAARSLSAAADHGLFTDDLFYHQTRAAARLRAVRGDDRLGLPPDAADGPGARVPVFPLATDGIPEKYQSHPTDHARELNATRVYVHGPRDDRSPWLLFGDTAGLKLEVTGNFYRRALSRREPFDLRPGAAVVVQDFIDAEHAETSYDPKYHGWYNGRFINPGDLKSLPAEPWPPAELAAWEAAWPPADLGQRNRVFRERQSERGLLRGLVSGNLPIKGQTFTYRSRQYALSEVTRLLAEIDTELDADVKGFDELDRRAFLAHWSLARHLDVPDGRGHRERELLQRYQFHMALQGLLQGMFSEQARLQAILGYLMSGPQMTAMDFVQVRNALTDILQSLTDNLGDAKRFETPTLANVPAGTSLSSLIADRGEIHVEHLQWNITGEWLGKLMARLDEVVGRINRLHFKSLGGLLALQEKLAREWQAGPGRSPLGPVTGDVAEVG